MLRKINPHCTASRNRAPKRCVDLLKSPKPLLVPAEFLKHMVPPPPIPYISEKPLSVDFSKGISYRYQRNTTFREN